MISNREGWQYIGVKKLPALLRGIASKKIRTKSLKSLRKVCQNNDFCNILMPSEGTKKLGINQYKKSDKAAFTIYADLEY